VSWEDASTFVGKLTATHVGRVYGDHLRQRENPGLQRELLVGV
jgi:hypothetical protein